MRLATTLFLCLLGSAALAQQCDRWTAGMEEDEGGPRMMASVCAQASASDADAQHALLVTCAGKDALSLRYLPHADESYPPDGNEEYITKMKFVCDQEEFVHDARFEGMDGAMVIDTNVMTPFVRAMSSEGKVTLVDVNSDKVPIASFTLNGAKEALDTLIKTCGQ
jgi:hypothetical protein